jgi:hypothetical protein
VTAPPPRKRTARVSGLNDCRRPSWAIYVIWISAVPTAFVGIVSVNVPAVIV